MKEVDIHKYLHGQKKRYMYVDIKRDLVSAPPRLASTANARGRGMEWVTWISTSTAHLEAQ